VDNLSDQTILAPPSMVDLVYSRLSQQISSGVLRGQLKIANLARDFQVSPLPVREALRRLEAQGLVHFNKRRVSVTELSVEGLRELFAIRLALEPMLLEGCVAALSKDESALDALRKDMEVMDQKGIGFNEWIEANRVFHQKMYTNTSQQHLRGIILTLWTAVEPYLRIYVHEAHVIGSAQEEHRQLLRFIESGDGPKAAKLLALHLENTLATTEKHLLADIEDDKPQVGRDNGREMEVDKALKTT
jgi:DNA-binding GntR family transcriptional regulator